MIPDELEKKNRPPELDLCAYPSKSIILASEERMVVRQCERKEVGALLEAVFPLIQVKTHYYDLVAARMAAELLGWYHYRIANLFALAGVIDGEIAGLVTSRLVDEKLGMSLHTIAIRRGLRVGAHLFAAKMEHHFDFLKQEEVWVIVESPVGLKRLMIEYALLDRAAEYPAIRHESGGVPTHVLTRENYEAARERMVAGARPLDAALAESAAILRPPAAYPQIPGYTRI
ncbi:MAG: hypothetical protein LBC99_11325 [Spirochaetota bacterium]|jgi:hypothetical protein|nr:hypothetical protein [Spirochaetota bacterium]